MRFNDLYFVVESDETEDESDLKDSSIKKEPTVTVKQESGQTPSASEKKDVSSPTAGSTVKAEKEQKDAQKLKEFKAAETELVRDLRAQVK